MATVYIYTLRDPRDGMIKYIGQSLTPEHRLLIHIKNRACNPDKMSWIESLRFFELEPVMEIVCEVCETCADAVEDALIRAYIDNDHPLLNRVMPKSGKLIFPDLHGNMNAKDPNLLRSLLVAKGLLRQKQIAAHFHVSENTVTRWLRGATMTAGAAERIAEFVNRDVNELFVKVGEVSNA